MFARWFVIYNDLINLQMCFNEAISTKNEQSEEINEKRAWNFSLVDYVVRGTSYSTSRYATLLESPIYFTGILLITHVSM